MPGAKETPDSSPDTVRTVFRLTLKKKFQQLSETD